MKDNKINLTSIGAFWVLRINIINTGDFICEKLSALYDFNAALCSRFERCSDIYASDALNNKIIQLVG